MRIKTFPSLAVLCGAVALPGITSAELPDSMAVLGDSISRATLANDRIDGLAYGQPQHSWATGYDSSDRVESHYERLEKLKGGTIGNYNLAQSGGKADDLPGQAYAAVELGAQYVVLNMGANDVCGMTPGDDFEADYREALGILKDGLPGATILVTAVGRVKRVYDVGRRDFWCRLKWATFQWCDNVLRSGRSQRNQADARNMEYNDILRKLSAEKGFAFDNGPYDWQFSKGNLSEVDCFHPDISGQQGLADRTYDGNRF